METLVFDDFLIGKEDRLEIISKIFQGEDVFLEGKYNLHHAPNGIDKYNFPLENLHHEPNQIDKYTSDILTLKGAYHQHVTKEYEEMKKFYKCAINLGNSTAMNNLGYYHQNVTEDYEEMEKYFLMAIGENNMIAMHNLGYYHQNVSNDFDKMEKYFLMSIELGNSDSMHNLGTYYKKLGNYELMEKYFLMAIGQNNCSAMHKLGNHHQQYGNYEEMKRYYKSSIELGHSGSMCNLALYYQKIGEYEEMKKYYLMAIELGNHVAMNNLGFFYEKQENYEEMKNYYLMAIKNGNLSALNNSIRYHSTHNVEFDFEIIENLNDTIVKITKNMKTYLENQFILFNPRNIIKNIYNKVNTDFCKSDFEIITQNKTYEVHSFVLDSEYFVCLTSGPFENKRNIKIEVENEKTIEILLEYLYLGKFEWKELEIEIMCELEKICDEYGFLDLLKNCKLAKFLKGLEF